MTAVAVVLMRDLFAVVMLTGIYSLLSASFFVVFDAVDVAFTEAAVGAGISTLLMLSTLTLTGRYAKESTQKPWLALAIVTVTGRWICRRSAPPRPLYINTWLPDI